MTLVSSDRPERRPVLKVLHFLADNNPFYVLSACCMLFGVFAINNSLAWSPLPLPNLLRMIVTLNVYEALLIAMAILLMRRGIRRDGMILILIEAFFLADVGFLNMEVFIAHRHVGLVVNALLLLAAGVKLALMLRAAGAEIFDRRFFFIWIQIAVLLAAPGFLAWIARPDDDHLSPLALYACWWAVGLLPAGYAMFVRDFAPFHRRRFTHSSLRAPLLVLRLLLILPLLSLIAHLSLAHWIYNVDFQSFDAAPLLLGVGFAMGRADQFVLRIGRRMALEIVLPLVAVALSAGHVSHEMIFTVAGQSISPLRLALAAAAVVYLDGLWIHRRTIFGAAALACLMLMCLGSTSASMAHHGQHLASSATMSLGRLMPGTILQWGFVSIAGAFILLIVGLLFSFRPRPSERR